ncbi:enoyl-CoA hydratase/isomerase family protein [Arachnia propionica]|uniref:3-hydroxyisobutyryl-CoA hydrolase n=1 Tax=Arachnia propionica TaxID=1750 RepID=A0A3P1T5U6_9ACTN|nr:enoyl-CoA hydratase/isomerase family protein [Arachnia propionica]RRD04704.1 enoyl-CoA hydratase/isomerase family protein [Arachnia propionica]
MTDLIATSVVDGVATLTLNRPRAINAFNLEMLEAAREALDAWARDDDVREVVLSGAGERGFCAGADVRELASMLTGNQAWLHFLEVEYLLDLIIAQYPKRTTVHMTGITMGGGLGLAVGADRRIVDASSRLAMPETKIGFFPDAGVMRWLAAAGPVGTHMALTSAVIGGGDALAMGLADESGDGELDAPLSRAEWIRDCYVGDDVVEIARRLAEHPDPDAQQAARDLRERSPFAVLVSMKALQRASTLDHNGVLHQDLRLAERMLPVDFVEGVRALLVDKDNAPRWRWATLEEVPREVVDEVFAY